MNARAFVVGLALLSGLLAAAVVFAEDGAPLRKVIVKLPFDEAELIVRSEAQRQNFNLVNVVDIQKGMENRGQTFRAYKIFQFCNLELGSRILADAPDYGAFPLCSVILYQVDAERTALVAMRQGWALDRLSDHRPGPDALEAGRRPERDAEEIFDAVVEEANARRR